MADQAKYPSSSGTNTYLMVPILIFFALLIFAVIRGPNLISQAGIGSAVIVVAPLVLATYALTIITMSGRVSVDLSIGPLIGFINVGMIQLHAAGFMESPIAFFLYAMGVGVAYQILVGIIIIFVRVQPIIVYLSGYLALVGLNLVILPRPGGVAPDWMFPWGGGTTIFSAILVILVLATIGWYLIARTAFFGHLRMMGSDERAAYTSGVHIYWVRLGAHAIGGVYAGLASITFTSLISSGDPTQGTTYTLMAVTALVLGGANLGGGRGGAFGSLLGALNIYLITYVLSTFSFGMVQSFVTDMAYGLMLVVSLLISIAVPHIRQYIRHMSPLVFFVILAVIALGVIMHTSMDQVVEPLLGASSTTGFVVLDDGGVAQASGGQNGAGLSAGTYILFIIIGAVAVVYAFHMLFKHLSVHMVAFMIVLGITALGLIFDPDESVESSAAEEAAQLQAPAGNLDSYTPTFFSLETTSGANQITDAISNAALTVIMISGVVLASSLIILVMLPQISMRTKRIAMFLFAAAMAVAAVGALFFDSFENNGYLTGTLSGEIYATMLVGVALFTITAPLVHTQFKNITNVFIASIGVLAVIAVYFFTAPVDTEAESTVEYAEPILAVEAQPAAVPQETAAGQSAEQPAETAAPIFAAGVEPSPPSEVSYPAPVRVNVGAGGMAAYAQVAYSAFIIVLLHVFLYIAMGERTFRSFWRHWEIPVFSAFLWGALFYATGVPLWQILAVVGVAIFSAPNVMHIISTYLVGESRDVAISQWSG